MKKISYLNSWKSRNKQSDKVNFEIRFGKLTFFELAIDFSLGTFRFMLMNLGCEKVK